MHEFRDDELDAIWAHRKGACFFCSARCARDSYGVVAPRKAGWVEFTRTPGSASVLDYHPAHTSCIEEARGQHPEAAAIVATMHTDRRRAAAKAGHAGRAQRSSLQTTTLIVTAILGAIAYSSQGAAQALVVVGIGAALFVAFGKKPPR